jgi:hypothetical protein
MDFGLTDSTFVEISIPSQSKLKQDEPNRVLDK